MLVAYFWKFGVKLSDIKPVPSNTAAKVLLPILAGSLLISPFLSSELVHLLAFSSPWAKAHTPEITALAILASFLLIYHSQAYKPSCQQLTTTIWWAVVFLTIALQILPYRVASINSVTLAPTWSVHLDAAMYALNQVIHGKTIIAELPSQYGLFPEIIAPLFKVTGISVLKVTAFFAALHALGLTAIAYLLRRHVKNPLLSILIFFSISIPMGLFIYLNGNAQDIYVQYFPIRFFWPAAALLLFSLYSSNQSRALYYLLTIASGIAVFWNVDTGIPVIVSIAATLFSKSLITRRLFGRAVSSAAFFTICFAIILAACFALLRFKAGVPLDISEALAYQKIFYMTGFGMIPMPLSLDPWQAVIIIYAAGAITALTAWQTLHQ